ncbi:flagellar motor protein MotB [Sphingomonas sp. ABOLD]|uniref:Chemotaxis protein MotB n=1 Tax=Sphingomonas trueperi TaxID=53317 RepID=A0A7X6BCW5_9SPHN|nr:MULTISPECIES: flagellar motor protein MotB [Sphingomonas]NJB97665.1 chemotaxis protein MotB [Sphingomonas trueperi]RSV43521.1 flagellar motor protein MotB [Sphingomonas sp. ABOLE]RSV52870.1 flagellar motor protein MotB [Sphingomonas sp. ABOLD]
MARGGDVRPIIVKKVKKVAGGHHGGAWKVAYADFVTAMMAFFMLLWLLANPDKDRLKGLAKYFSPTIADSGPSTPVSNSAPGAGGPTRRSEADPSAAKGQPTFEVTTAGSARGGTADVPATMRVMASELMVALEATPQSQGKKNVDVQQDRQGLRITLMDTDQQPMFKSNTAELNPYARTLLTKLAKKIATVGAQIAIEGHTDGAGGQSDANWQLSGERALAARSALIAGGVTPDRFAEVVAMGATQPVYPDQPNRAENRRISIVLKGQTSALPSDSSFKF